MSMNRFAHCFVALDRRDRRRVRRNAKPITRPPMRRPKLQIKRPARSATSGSRPPRRWRPPRKLRTPASSTRRSRRQRKPKPSQKPQSIRQSQRKSSGRTWKYVKSQCLRSRGRHEMTIRRREFLKAARSPLHSAARCRVSRAAPTASTTSNASAMRASCTSRTPMRSCGRCFSASPASIIGVGSMAGQAAASGRQGLSRPFRHPPRQR